MTASGTSGHGTELAEYGDLRALGAVVVKSLSVEPWPGNPAPRVHEVGAGMLNSVGLQGPGLAAWVADDLPALADAGARVVVSIWGQSVEDYARAAELVADAARSGAGACIVARRGQRQLPQRGGPLAHVRPLGGGDGAACSAATACGLPRWAKLSPNVPDIVEIAAGAVEGGADGLTLVNTLLGLALDTEIGPARPGAGGGGLSGAAVHPVAVRAVWECRAAFPDAADRRRGRGGAGHGRGGAARWPAPTPCRSGRPPSATPGHRGRCCASWRVGATATPPRWAASAAGRGAWRRRDTRTATSWRAAVGTTTTRPRTSDKEDTMADSFGDRVACRRGAGPDPCAPGSTRRRRCSPRGD